MGGRGLEERRPPAPCRVPATAVLALSASLCASLRLLVSAWSSAAFLGLGRRRRYQQWEQPDDDPDGEGLADLWQPSAQNGTEPPATPAVETVTIVMPTLPKGRVGVNMVTEKTQVSRVLYQESFVAGWRVGDEVVEVNGRPISSSEDLHSATAKALSHHNRTGAPLRFKVKRWLARNAGKGMLRMTNGNGVDHAVPMFHLLRGILEDYPVILLMEGTLARPRRGFSSRAVAALDRVDAVYRALDCADEKFNPGVRRAAEELSGQAAMPQLYVSGKLVGAGRDLLRLPAAALKGLLQEAGALNHASASAA